MDTRFILARCLFIELGLSVPGRFLHGLNAGGRPELGEGARGRAGPSSNQRRHPVKRCAGNDQRSRTTSTTCNGYTQHAIGSNRTMNAQPASAWLGVGQLVSGLHRARARAPLRDDPGSSAGSPARTARGRRRSRSRFRTGRARRSLFGSRPGRAHNLGPEPATNGLPAHRSELFQLIGSRYDADL